MTGLHNAHPETPVSPMGRHSGEGRNPVGHEISWIPAFAGMTIFRVSGQALRRCVALVALLLPGVGIAERALDIDGTSIIGNRELPKVLNIVPWKPAQLGDLEGRPIASLVDEVLEPVDREVFQRQLEYYDTVHGSR